MGMWSGKESHCPPPQQRINRDKLPRFKVKRGEQVLYIVGGIPVLYSMEEEGKWERFLRYHQGWYFFSWKEGMIKVHRSSLLENRKR